MTIISLFLSEAIGLFTIILVANAILSWFVFASNNPTLQQIYWTTSKIVNPVLDPMRKIIGPMTSGLGIDISPLILIVLLQAIERMLRGF